MILEDQNNINSVYFKNIFSKILKNPQMRWYLNSAHFGPTPRNAVRGPGKATDLYGAGGGTETQKKIIKITGYHQK